MATDFWGQELHIGDPVTYIEFKYRNLDHGVIVNLGDKKATIQTDKFKGQPELETRMGFGRTCREYRAIVKEVKSSGV